MQLEYIAQETNTTSEQIKLCSIGHYYRKLALFLEKEKNAKNNGQSDSGRENKVNGSNKG